MFSIFLFPVRKVLLRFRYKIPRQSYDKKNNIYFTQVLIDLNVKSVLDNDNL